MPKLAMCRMCAEVMNTFMSLQESERYLILIIQTFTARQLGTLRCFAVEVKNNMEAWLSLAEQSFNPLRTEG